jgi:hypothetical protein
MVTLLGSDAYTEAFIETLRTGMRGQILLSAEQRDLMARSMALGIGSQGGFAVPFQLDPAIMLKMRASERARYAA